MSRVIADISMSLDGFISGPNDGVDELHQWLYDLASWRERHNLAGGETGADSDVLAEAFENVGTVVLGRRMFDLTQGWGENPPFHVPVFVVTHEAREPLAKEGGTTFNFVADGIESALSQARAAAGGRDVSVAGGASVIQQVINAGQLDEIQLHLVPILLGDGKRLFDRLGPAQIELESTRVIESPGVTHLRYRVVT
jgi:dihydrofolate reductase